LLLIGANFIAAFALAVDAEVGFRLGFVASDPSAISAVASMFIHANLVHLLGNMVFLGAVGPAAELSLGQLKFFALYFFGGIVGVLAHWAMLRGVDTAAPLLGASGAVAACVGYSAVRFGGVRVPLAPKFGVRVAVVIALWALLQVAGAYVHTSDLDRSPAFWAHLGGLLAGLLAGVLFRAPKAASRAQGEEAMARMQERGPAAALVAANEYLASHPGDPGAVAAKAAAEDALGDHEAEAETWLGALDSLPQASVRLGQLKRLGAVPPPVRASLADKWSESRPDAARALLASVADGPAHESLRPECMLRLVQLLAETEPAEARRYAEALAEEYPLHPATEIAKARAPKP
jgi:membrane associated rhomboid family serine protease